MATLDDYRALAGAAERAWGCERADRAQAWREQALMADGVGDSGHGAMACLLAELESSDVGEDSLSAGGVLDEAVMRRGVERAIVIAEARMRAEARQRRGAAVVAAFCRSLSNGRVASIDRTGAEVSERARQCRTLPALATYLGLEHARAATLRRGVLAWGAAHRLEPNVAKEVARRGW